MAKSKRIEFGNENSGIAIEYNKSKDTLYIFGWYDHFIGIEGGSITFKELCEKLGKREEK